MAAPPQGSWRFLTPQPLSRSSPSSPAWRPDASRVIGSLAREVYRTQCPAPEVPAERESARERPTPGSLGDAVGAGEPERADHHELPHLALARALIFVAFAIPIPFQRSDDRRPHQAAPRTGNSGVDRHRDAARRAREHPDLARRARGEAARAFARRVWVLRFLAGNSTRPPRNGPTSRYCSPFHGPSESASSAAACGDDFAAGFWPSLWGWGVPALDLVSVFWAKSEVQHNAITRERATVRNVYSSGKQTCETVPIDTRLVS